MLEFPLNFNRKKQNEIFRPWDTIAKYEFSQDDLEINGMQVMWPDQQKEYILFMSIEVLERINGLSILAVGCDDTGQDAGNIKNPISIFFRIKIVTPLNYSYPL